MAALAKNSAVAEYDLDVSLPLQYAKKVLDKNYTGLISIQQLAKAPVLRNLLVSSSVFFSKT
jgi:hypothetical protein